MKTEQTETYVIDEVMKEIRKDWCEYKQGFIQSIRKPYNTLTGNPDPRKRQPIQSSICLRCSRPYFRCKHKTRYELVEQRNGQKVYERYHLPKTIVGNVLFYLWDFFASVNHIR